MSLFIDSFMVDSTNYSGTIIGAERSGLEGAFQCTNVYDAVLVTLVSSWFVCAIVLSLPFYYYFYYFYFLFFVFIVVFIIVFITVFNSWW